MAHFRGANPLAGYVTHGVKIITSDTYVLKIDTYGEAIIQKVFANEEDIKFTFKETGTIADFWADPTAHTYKYLYEV